MTVSEVALKGVARKVYKGLRMHDLTPELQPQVKCTFAISTADKYVQEGILTFDRHENSHTYSACMH